MKTKSDWKEVKFTTMFNIYEKTINGYKLSISESKDQYELNKRYGLDISPVVKTGFEVLVAGFDDGEGINFTHWDENNEVKTLVEAKKKIMDIFTKTFKVDKKIKETPWVKNPRKGEGFGDNILTNLKKSFGDWNVCIECCEYDDVTDYGYRIYNDKIGVSTTFFDSILSYSENGGKPLSMDDIKELAVKVLQTFVNI